MIYVSSFVTNATEQSVLEKATVIQLVNKPLTLHGYRNFIIAFTLLHIVCQMNQVCTLVFYSKSTRQPSPTHIYSYVHTFLLHSLKTFALVRR
jgi:hypothetical protein